MSLAQTLDPVQLIDFAPPGAPPAPSAEEIDGAKPRGRIVLEIAEAIEAEASYHDPARRGGRDDPSGAIIAEVLRRAADLVRFVYATSAEEYFDRLEVMDRGLVEAAYERGLEHGLSR